MRVQQTEEYKAWIDKLAGGDKASQRKDMALALSLNRNFKE